MGVGGYFGHDFSSERERQGAPPPIVFARVCKSKKGNGLFVFLRSSRVKRVRKEKEGKELDDLEGRGTRGSEVVK
jgi:hypothetical protein